MKKFFHRFLPPRQFADVYKHWQKCLAFFLFILLSISSNTFAQSIQSGTGVPIEAFEVDNGPRTITVTVLGGPTQTGTLTVTLPTGFVYVSQSATVTSGGITVSQTNVTNNVAVLSLAGIPTSGNSASFTYKAYASCSAIGGSDNQVKYQLGANSEVLSNGIEIQNAKINITNLQNSPISSGAVGDLYTRTFRINNNGFGNIDTVYVTDVSGIGVEHISHSVSPTDKGTSVDVSLVSTATAGNSTTYKYRFIISNTPQDAHLGRNEYFTFTQNLRINSCNNLTTSLNAWYGSGNLTATPCAGQNSTQTTALAIDNSKTPNISVALDKIDDLTCTSSSSDNQWITAKVTNAGSAKATAINLRFGLGSYSTNLITGNQSFGGQAAITWIDPADQAEYSLDGVTWLTATKSHSLNIINSSNANDKNLDVTITIPEIGGSQALFVRFKRHITCTTGCSAKEFRNISLINGNYNNACGSSAYNIAPQLLIGDGYAKANITTDMATDVIEGQTYEVKFEIQEWNLPRALAQQGLVGPDAYTEMVVELPSCLKADASTLGLSINNFSGTSASIPSQTTVESGGSIVRIRFNLSTLSSSNWTILQKVLKFNTTLDCSVACPNPEISAKVTFHSTASCNCVREIGCATWQPNIRCVTPCEDGGIQNTVSSVKRTSTIIADSNNDGIADGIDVSKVRTNHFTVGDKLRVTAKGYVLGNHTIEYAYLETIAPTTPQLTVVANSATVEIKDASNPGTTLTVTGLPITGTYPNLKVDVSKSVIQAVYPAFGGYEVSDTIKVSIDYDYPIGTNINSFPTTANTALANPVDAVFRNIIYGGTVANPTPEQRYSCSSEYLATAKYHSWSTTLSRVGRNLRYVGCQEDNLDGALIGVQYFAQFDNINTSRSSNVVFPYEINEKFRPLKYILTVPVGLEVVRIRASLNGQPSVILTNPTISGQEYSYDLAQLFPAGPIDEGFNLGIVPVMKASCEAFSAATSGNLSNKITYVLVDDPALAVRTFEVSWPYSIEASGNINATASVPVKTVTSDKVTWEVQVTNTGNQVALPNVWLAKNPNGGTVTIQAIERLATSGATSGTPITPTSNVYRLGAVPASSSQYYLITASFENCNQDDLQLAYGWHCNGYPSSVEDAICLTNLDLTVIPTNANLQVAILSQPTNTPVNLCTELEYVVEVKNPAQGTASDVQVTVKKPTGIAYVSGSYQLSHTILPTSATLAAISDANVLETPTTITFSIPASTFTELPYNDGFTIRYKVKSTACNFISGTKMTIQAIGKNGCGSTINGTQQQTQTVRIIGENPNPNSYTITSSISGSIEACSSPSPNIPIYSFSAANIGPVATYAGEKLVILIPEPYALGTIVPGTNFGNFGAPTVTNDAGNNVYTWTVPTGIAAGQSMEFTAPIIIAAETNRDELVCGASAPIKEYIAYTFSSTCVSSGPDNGTVCSGALQAEGENETTTITVVKPAFGITSVTATKTSVDQFGGTVTISNGTPSAQGSAQNAVLKVYHDSNSNGIIDAGEELLGEQNIALTGNASQVINYSITTTYQGDVCPALIEVTTTCACTTPVVYSLACDVSLPVKLVSFEARQMEEGVSLAWSTGEEVNSDRFEIQRSDDSNKWQDIGTTPASGDSKSLRQYNFTDNTPTEGLNYYRLKMVDRDETFVYSLIRSVEVSGVGISIVYPNPVTDNLTLRSTNGINKIEITDIKGVTVYHTNKIANKTINVKNLAPGLYLVKITRTDGRVDVEKVIKR